MQVVPLNAVPNQNLTIGLANQNTQMNIRQSSKGLFLSLAVNNTQIISGVLCLNETVIVRDAYLGFIGDLCFKDTQGDTDPIYTGLGDRYQLVYLTPDELAAFGLQ